MAHIGMVVPTLGGGVGRTVLTVTRGLVDRGHDVDLVLFKPSVAYPEEVPSAARMFVLSKRTGCPPVPVAVEWQPDHPSLLQAIKLAARLIRAFPHPSTVLRCRRLLRALRLHRYASREQPDVLFIHAPSLESPALFAARIGRGFPRVVPVLHGKAGRRAMRRRRLFFPLAAHVVAVSRGVGESTGSAIDMPSDRLSVIYNPTDMAAVLRYAEEPPDHPWFEYGAPPVILSAGRLAREKDFLTLIEAFRRVMAVRPCRLIVLGEGRCRAELEDRIRALGMEAHVSLPGWADNPFAFMSRSTLFALSSLHEGLGNVLVEAMVCGCPAVSTDCPGGVAEVLQDPKLLAPVGDPDALASVMLQALDRPVDRADIQAKTEPFTMKRAIDGYELVLRMVSVDP